MFGDKEFGDHIGYPTPTDVPTNTTDLLVRIPASAAWWSVFFGLVSTLMEEGSWQQFDGGITPEEAAEAARNIYIAAYEEAINPVTNCCFEGARYKYPSQATGYRVQDGIAQFTYDGATWTDLPNEDLPPRIPPLTATNGADDDARKCNAAERAVLVCAQFYQETFGAFGAGLLETLDGITNYLASWAPRIIQEDVYPFSAVVQVHQYEADWSSTSLFDGGDSLSDEAKDLLRCLLLDNATVETGDLVTFDWEAVTDNVISVLGTNPGTAIFLLLSYIGPEGLNRAGNVGDAVGDCSACDAWCYEFDFTVSDQGFVATGAPSTAGVYVAGQGWAASNVSIWKNVNIKRYGMTPAVVTHAEIDFYVSNGWSSGQSGYLNDNGTWTFNIYPWSAGENTVAQDVSAPATTDLNAYLNLDANQGQTGYIRRIRYSGTGPNPFGTDNC